MQECGVHDLKSTLEADPDCVLVDVREYPETAAGRISRARLMPLATLATRAAELDKSQTVYLICRSGRRSAEGKRQLDALGFQDVRSVQGGMQAWIEAGLPIARDANPPWSLERQVRLVAGALVLGGVLLSLLVARPFVLLSGFVGAGLMFAAITDSCAMGMLLARMPWNRGAACSKP